MAFIRLKKRKVGDKTVEYAYLVKNRWDRKLGSPRQSVSRYLGRVYSPERTEDISFIRHLGIEDPAKYVHDTPRNRIINDLARWEISCHRTDGATLSRGSVFKGGRKIVLKINDGYLCRHTLNKLYNFSPKGDDPHFIGMDLATRFSEAGIRIPKEVFIPLFDRFSGTKY